MTPKKLSDEKISDITEQRLYQYSDRNTVVKLLQHIRAVEAEIETERMRLAACSTAALGYFESCHDDYWSASLTDVLALRASSDALRAERDAFGLEIAQLRGLITRKVNKGTGEIFAQTQKEADALARIEKLRAAVTRVVGCTLDTPCLPDGAIQQCRSTLIQDDADAKGETTYPCEKCGKPRTKAEGGTTFTVCDTCWDKHYDADAKGMG